MRREDFLARVKAAAAAGRAYRVSARTDIPPTAGYVGGGDDLVARFAAEVNFSGGKSILVDSDAEARAALLQLIERYGAQRLLCWEHPLLERLGVAPLLAARGLESASYATLLAMPNPEQRRQMLAAQLGITSVWHAVAETGTLAMASQPGRERVASLLPPVHVAIVERAQILPDLFDLFAAIEATYQGDMPSNLVLITGPSKTGDIELKLTTGVHGPGNWHVIVIRN